MAVGSSFAACIKIANNTSFYHVHTRTKNFTVLQGLVLIYPIGQLSVPKSEIACAFQVSSAVDT